MPSKTVTADDPADQNQNSDDGHLHFVASFHGTTLSQRRSGQRKPFTVPSNTLVLISLGVIQNFCPQFGQVSLYRCSMWFTGGEHNFWVEAA